MRRVVARIAPSCFVSASHHRGRGRLITDMTDLGCSPLPRTRLRRLAQPSFSFRLHSFHGCPFSGTDHNATYPHLED